MISETPIAAAIAAIRAELPEYVRLVAVSKTHPEEAIEEAYACGQRHFGESRPLELKRKYEALPKDIEWHMIGHLQTNKIKYIIPFVSLIESVDSARLAEAIEREAAKHNRTVDVLLEIHVAQEESKTGWDYGALSKYVAEGGFRALPHLRVRGVMGIATNTEDEEVIRNDFKLLRGAYEALKPAFDDTFDTLSMGMSDDYPLAIACGSTSVRIGSRIFGLCDYSK